MTFLLHIADNSSQLMRRYFLWTIPIISALPTVLFAESISAATNIYDVVATIGGLMFVLAIFTLICMPCTYESIIFLLESGNDLRALEIMLKLRNESRHFIRRDFNEFKMMLAEDISDTGNVLHTGYYRPLFAVLLLRILNALAASNSIYWIFLANVMFDFQSWTLLNPTANMQIENVTMAMSDIANISRFDNETEYLTKPYDLLDTTETSTIYIDTIADYIYNNPFNQTDIVDIDNITSTTPMMDTTEFADEFADDSIAERFVYNCSQLNETLWPDEADGVTEIDPTFVDLTVNHSLSVSQLTQFVLAVVAIKIIVGIVVMCMAETFKIYRNRIILKATLWIGLINTTFFLLTLICYRFDDNFLLFTFYISKLVNLIYACYLLVAFAIDTIGYCELAESFSLATRYRYMAAVFICEHSIYAGAILMIMCAQYTFVLFALQSLIVCLICYCLLRFMPNDSLDLTLRGARDKYFVKIATANT